MKKNLSQSQNIQKSTYADRGQNLLRKNYTYSIQQIVEDRKESSSDDEKPKLKLHARQIIRKRSSILGKTVKNKLKQKKAPQRRQTMYEDEYDN